ncbi:hypothetical protein Cs7R123_31670 [Catellatospora sp. TT07R-123]|uniref:SCO2522 family protein n=1 Tax=Catellatospora sp. TT07R-123 TaxID=2733863 RepID=UPI001B0C7EB0|nr:SCO2522 family protein [Catellatospora sp. TT07R-123]GHJ45825.1 hypothetical protein Cs7R123_31670 [Catellatospora sp. TT07R-123]
MTESVFVENSASPKTDELPLSHLSIELGHLYMEDFMAGYDRLRQMFVQVKPWAEAAEGACRAVVGAKARISTCFLIDDYFSRFDSPQRIVPMLQEAARESKLTIDYLARESSCAATGSVRPVDLVHSRLVPEPVPGTTGAERPAVGDIGWLCNGQRSPGVAAMAQAMDWDEPWQPPRQNAVDKHSIFMDVQLWDKPEGWAEADGAGESRRWSCPMLAAVWQLLRLGLLRDEGRAVAAPVPAPEPLPESWADLPAVIRLNPKARPFFAYRTFTAMNSRFLPVEDAVRTILSQVGVDPAADAQLVARATADGLRLPREVLGRIDYAFVGAWTPAAVRSADSPAPTAR